jgi:hypothetical protein
MSGWHKIIPRALEVVPFYTSRCEDSIRKVRIEVPGKENLLEFPHASRIRNGLAGSFLL